MRGKSEGFALIKMRINWLSATATNPRQKTSGQKRTQDFDNTVSCSVVSSSAVSGI